MLVWAIPRTSHHTAMGIERAGFEIRDVVTHLFGSGFPKSLNVNKAINTDAAARWRGWGTALKPASEHWILARKPLDGTVAANVLEYGTGALNIDGCRIVVNGKRQAIEARGDKSLDGPVYGSGLHGSRCVGGTTLGRWPSNLTLDEEAAAMLDEQSGPKKASFLRNRTDGARPFDNAGKPTNYSSERIDVPETPGGASRFFYVAKASKADKTANGTVENTHPTVKNTALMRWLVRLITPPGGTVLDPFMGSGSTGVACIHEGFSFVGMEREENFFEIARKRIRYAGLSEGRRADEKPATDDDDEEEGEDSEG
jgi:site-specific DNA-methyltransferase (adenine-specific)